MGRFVRRGCAALLIAPVCVEHRPHLDLPFVASEPVPTMPFNLQSTVTANIMLPRFGGDFIIVGKAADE